MRILLTSKYRLWPLWLALAVLLGTTAFAACGQATTSSSSGATSPSGTTASAQVKMVTQNGQYAFQPATLTISKGTKVTWTNTSEAPHTVTSDTNAFNTPSSLQQNQTFSMTFTTAGTFAYHCSIHPYMKATITVTS